MYISFSLSIYFPFPTGFPPLNLTHTLSLSLPLSFSNYLFLYHSTSLSVPRSFSISLPPSLSFSLHLSLYLSLSLSHTSSSSLFLSFSAVSAWNDNGQKTIVRDSQALYRSDFFPGLGWMMKRSVWLVCHLFSDIDVDRETLR